MKKAQTTFDSVGFLRGAISEAIVRERERKLKARRMRPVPSGMRISQDTALRFERDEQTRSYQRKVATKIAE